MISTAHIFSSIRSRLLSYRIQHPLKSSTEQRRRRKIPTQEINSRRKLAVFRLFSVFMWGRRKKRKTRHVGSFIWQCWKSRFFCMRAKPISFFLSWFFFFFFLRSFASVHYLLFNGWLEALCLFFFLSVAQFRVY